MAAQAARHPHVQAAARVTAYVLKAAAGAIQAGAAPIAVGDAACSTAMRVVYAMGTADAAVKLAGPGSIALRSWTFELRWRPNSTRHPHIFWKLVTRRGTARRSKHMVKLSYDPHADG